MASEYKYLNQSECLVIDGGDDGMKFHKLVVIQMIVCLWVEGPLSLHFISWS
jgi:hypothetical protein